MNSHIDLGQPNITKINISSDHAHPEEKIISSESHSINEQPIEQSVVPSTNAPVMPSLNNDSPVRKASCDSIKMSMYLM
jgi:hypothetical protein